MADKQKPGKPGGEGGGGVSPSVAFGIGAAFLGVGLVAGWLAAGGAVAAGPVIAGGIIIVIGGGLIIGGTRGGGCFVQGTEVLMADMTRKPIERIAINDVVLSRHEKTGVIAGRRVSNVFVHNVGSTLNFTLVSGQTIGTTEVHRFALGIGNFSPAKSIDVGTKLCTDVSSTELLRREIVPGKARVYNFSVEEFNTYFVGQDRVWVHNLKKGDPSEPPEGDDDP